MRPLTVVGHQHQAGGIDVQATGGVQLIGNRLIEEIQHRRMIGIVRRTHVTLRFIEHKVARARELLQRVAVKRHHLLRGQFQGSALNHFTVDGDAFGPKFTRYQRTANT
ncbi:hypothetical protein D3C72_1134370 [compost metagenome]